MSLNHNHDIKWLCKRCTYSNYPKAKKCTMCADMRPLQRQMIIDNESEQTNSPDIYKMALKDDHNEKVSKKWSCVICTFLNYPKSLKCTQCLTSKKSGRISPSSASQSVNTNDVSCETTVKTNANTNTNSNTNTNTNTNANTTVSPERDRSEFDKDSYYNDRNRSETLSLTNGFKWSCIACTYDNWEASKKCILCSTPKNLESISERQQSLTCSELAAEERRHTPSPPGAAKVITNTIQTNIISSTKFNNQNNLKNQNNLNGQSDITAAAHLNYITDDRCNDLYDILIANTSQPIAKRAPSDVSRYLTNEIRRSIVTSLKQRKGEFPCYFVNEFVTFALPAEVEDLPTHIQERLFDEYLDRDVQKELEEECPIINWNIELTERLGSRLYALWNRSTGDCLLDSVLQATWGIFDRDNILRKALGDSLSEGSSVLFPRFKEAETLQANMLHFTLDDDQWQEDWAVILSLATQPGQSLEQIHIFTLAHILRRPIIVYAIRIVKSFRGETLGYAGYEGIYLPLLWEPSFCWKSPIALGYTRGHFSALVPIEPESSDEHIGAGANFRSNDDNEVIFLPLVTSEQQLLPLHFLGQNEVGREEEIMRQWLDCCVTTGGILVAKQKIPRKPILVAQMMDEWLDFYRNLSRTGLPLSVQNNVTQDYSSDADSDQDV